jgi:hypothetical protein
VGNLPQALGGPLERGIGLAERGDHVKVGKIENVVKDRWLLPGKLERRF